MNNLFDTNDTASIMARIARLQPESLRQWGTMDVAQMMAHCSEALKTATGESKPPRVFIGYLLGPLFRPAFLGDKPFQKNAPTAPILVVSDQRVFDAEKQRLIACVQQFVSGGASKCTDHPHAFFGKMNPDQWARIMYKHLDHHLRQFNC